MDPLILQKLQKALKFLISEKVLTLDKNNISSEIELSFLAPSGEFVESLGSAPSINCYLVGLNEDKSRRKSESHRSRINDQQTQRVTRKEPRFVDLTYMLTIWSKDKSGGAEIEHLIMGYLLCGLGLYDFLPQKYLDQYDLDIGPYGIHFSLFGSEYSDKISGQIWQAMGSTPKPCLMLSLSVPVEVHEPTHIPIVQEINRILDGK